MAYDAGTAFLQIVPSFRGFGARVRREAAEAGRQAGTIFNEEFNRTARRAGDSTQVGPSRSSSARQGAASGGAFAEAFKARLEAAQRAIGDIEIGVATSAAEQRVRDLRIRIQAELTALKDARIGVDIDEATAKAKLTTLMAQLQILGQTDPDVRVRVDSGAALAELKLLQTQINRLDGQNPTVTPIVNPGPAVAGIGLIGLAALTLLPILIPIGAAATAALAGIATGAIIATAGLAVLAAALVPIVKAVMAGKAADEEAEAAGASLAGARNAQANAAAQLRSAERALANTKASAAVAARDAARAIVDAEDRVKDARRAAADAVEDAARRTADAEDRLADAQEQAEKAQKSLTQARREAKDDLADLDTKIAKNALAQRQAALDLEKAESDLAFVREFGLDATTRQVEKAQLAYDEALQKSKDLTAEGKALTAEQARANKVGIDGSEKVLAAKESIAQANEAVADAEATVRDARKDEGDAAAKGAREIADAQEAVGRARERAAEQARQSAFAIQNAEDAVASAERARAQASVSAGVAGQSAAKKYENALLKLSPAGREFVRFLREDLFPVFSGLSKVAQNALLPGLQAGLKGMMPLLGKPLKAFVKATGEAFGGLFESLGNALGSPAAQEFLAWFTSIIGPNVKLFGRIVGGSIRLLLGLFRAFEPISRSFGTGLANMLERFSKVTEDTAKGKDNKLTRFLAYVQKVGPKVGKFFNELGDALGNIFRGFAPIGEVMLTVLGGVFDVIGKLDPKLITAIATAFIVFSVAMAAVGAVMAVMAAGPLTLIVAGIAAVVAAFVYAYLKFDSFRAVVNGLFRSLADGVKILWDYVIHPIVRAFEWLYDVLVGHSIVPDLVNRITYWFKRMIDFVRPIFSALKSLITDVLAPAFTWLWQKVIVPVFKGIATVIGIWWAGASAIFSTVVTVLGGLWTAFQTAVDLVATAWDKFGGVIEAPWTWIKTYVLTPIGKVFGALWTVFRDAIALIGPAWTKFQDKIKAPWTWVKTWVLTPIGKVFGALWEVFRDAIALIDKAWDKLKDTIKKPYNWVKVNVLTPMGNVFGDLWKTFESAVKAIGKAWDAIKEKALSPVRFVIETVINKGIIKGINTITGLFGIPKIPDIPVPGGSDKKYETGTGGRLSGGRFAGGGVLPGYTPGRDVHAFYSPTAGGLHLSGGEAIMRPEWTRAVGSDYVAGMNSLARQGGATAIRKALGGRGFAFGGIWDKVKDVAGKTKDLSLGAFKALTDPVGFVREKLSGTLGRLAELGDNPFIQALKKVPGFLIDKAVDAAKRVLGIGVPGKAGHLSRGMAFAKDQESLPYVFGGTGRPLNGETGWDCSGFMGAIAAAIVGDKNPLRRFFTTDSFANGPIPGWSKGTSNGFMIGVVQGDPGHMAGTLGGRVNVESRAGDGVVIGPSARGALDALFTDRFHLAGYDSGGVLPPGVTMAVNRSGKPEAILSASQWSAISALAAGGDGATAVQGSGPLVSIGEFHATPEQSPYAIANEFAWLSRGRGE